MFRHFAFIVFCIILLVTFSLGTASALHPASNTQMVKGTLAVNPPPKLVEDEIIVKFKPVVLPSQRDRMVRGLPSGIDSLDQLLKKHAVYRVEVLYGNAQPPQKQDAPDFSRTFRLHFSSRVNPLEMVRRFSRNPHIEYAQPIGIHPVRQIIPNDPGFVSQWALSQANDHDVDAPEAWSIDQGDSSVILAVVDTGVDYQHPDLDGNIWLNESEYTGTVGLDDDGNGYVDDVRGWDFVNIAPGAVWTGEDAKPPDDDPMDFNGHGTHVAGIASAVTNNAIGVAGLGWNCKIMALRAGYSGILRDRGVEYEVGYVRMDYCAEAIYYAVNHGAIAINCSWGSSYTGDLAAAVDYAISQGVLMVVAAGNDNSSTQDYLASRGDCIDVSATDTGDRKSSFSNYGAWVDVSAPGSSILSTYYDHDTGGHLYAYISGTSMSAPFVTGLVGLLKSYQPVLTDNQIKDIIYNSADNIDSLNPAYVGQLGSGRINAHAALTVIDNPYLSYDTLTIDDTAGGNNDGSVDPGETAINLIVTLVNRGYQNATGVTASLTTADPYTTIVSSDSGYPDLTAGGGTGSALMPYIFSVSSSCPDGHKISFQLSISADGGYSRSETFISNAGTSPILIWDDDGGDAPFNGNGDEFGPADGEEKPFEVALSEMGYNFDTVSSLPSDLSAYRVIFVVLGYYTGDEVLMTPTEQNQLVSFMDQGGNVYIEGVDFGYDYSSTTLYSYFMCSYQGDGNQASVGNVSSLSGVAGTLTEGMTFSYDYQNSPDHYVDEIGSNGGTIFWQDQGGIGRGISYNAGNGSRRIHTPVMLGGMTDGTSPSTRQEYLRQVMDFFGLSPERTAEIKLPQPGWTLFGIDFPVSLLWHNSAVSNGIKIKSITEAAGEGWISSDVYYFDTATESYLATPGSDQYLQNCRGCWLWSEVGNLTLLLSGEDAALPAVQFIDLPDAGWTLFSSYHDQLAWNEVQIESGLDSAIPTQAEALGWIQSDIYYWDPELKMMKLTPDEDSYLRWYRGYWLLSRIDGLRLVLSQP